MSFIGTFGMFTTVRLGIYTSQQGLNLTGNNISNINTVGYTRQTLDIKSMNAGGVDRYTDSNVRIGNGAIATGISQLRDPYLDIRYRTECASVGYMDTKLSNLNDLAAIIDEVGKGEEENGIVSAQLSDLLASLERLTEYTGQGEFDTQVRESALSLVKLFNYYSTSLEQVETNAVDRFKQDVITVNELLTNIQNLNTSIRKGDIHGVPSLESRDERNRLIDKLSQYLKIDVTYDTEEIAAGIEIEKLNIKLADTYEPNEIRLVDGIYAVQFMHDEFMPRINPDYDGTDATMKYLDVDNNPTNDVTRAAKDANTNYNLTLSELKDSKGNIYTKYLNVTPAQTFDLTDPTKIPTEPAGLEALITALNGAGDWEKESWTVTSADGKTKTDYLLRKITDDAGNVGYSIASATKKVSVETPLSDTILYGSLQAAREFLTESGEFATEGYINLVDPNAASKRGVRYYQKALDLLANKFATQMNEANNGYLYVFDKDANTYFYVDKNGQSLGIEKRASLDDLSVADRETLEQNGVKAANSGNLFSVRGDTNEAFNANGGITASNISISSSWASGEFKIVNSYEIIPGTQNQIGSTDNSNILHMVNLMNRDMDYAPSELIDAARDDTMFTGSFGEMLGNINAVLGNDQNSTQIMLDNYYTSAVELDTSRDSVSSVDLNDETVNMIQYQKSYSAACRLMTAMDEILDKLINGTGVAGR